jgi:hypothetical protein
VPSHQLQGQLQTQHAVDTGQTQHKVNDKLLASTGGNNTFIQRVNKQTNEDEEW